MRTMRDVSRRMSELRGRALMWRWRRRPDGYLCSFPRSGRTWLRFIVSNYIVLTTGRSEALDFRTLAHLSPDLEERRPERNLTAFAYWRAREVPLVVASHMPWRPWRFRGAPIVLLVREAADALVSWHLHLTRHERGWEGSLEEFLLAPGLGVAAYADYLNRWAEAPAAVWARTLATSYERLAADVRSVTRGVLVHLGLALDDDALDVAVERSRFHRMVSLESQGFPGVDYDFDDVDARRVRRGKIGSGRAVLDLETLDRELDRRLTPAAWDLLRSTGVAQR